MTGSHARLFIEGRFVPQDEDGPRRVAALLVATRSGVRTAVDPATPGAGGDGPVRLARAHREGRARRDPGDPLLAALAAALGGAPGVRAVADAGHRVRPGQRQGGSDG